ncbi:hypothetical protein JSQ81_11915 [Sporosarcina sp. Marseille-Q4063]|uniref:hypothetical protein n=1 Tax=Sporosarcina sp. Marseille-Q4063 TaxID=2810514 RepID=UPI001BB02DEE|nr:hypothetical protein [Sporosarcina sp. Marseille-Q4063]QUW24104.1 hypothetical protein JSQ81_11915 [Sporosarcina sp. Marseille-Q4063]
MGVAGRDETSLCVVVGNGLKVDLELWGSPFFVFCGDWMMAGGYWSLGSGYWSFACLIGRFGVGIVVWLCALVVSMRLLVVLTKFGVSATEKLFNIMWNGYIGNEDSKEKEMIKCPTHD